MKILCYLNIQISFLCRIDFNEKKIFYFVTFFLLSVICYRNSLKTNVNTPVKLTHNQIYSIFVDYLEEMDRHSSGSSTSIQGKNQKFTFVVITQVFRFSPSVQCEKRECRMVFKCV